jgi:hypothetical protein
MNNKTKTVFNLIFKIKVLYFMIFIFGFIIFLIINLKVTAAQTCIKVQYEGCDYACKNPDGSIICEYTPQIPGGIGSPPPSSRITYVGAVCKEEGEKIICSGGEKASSETQQANLFGVTKTKDGNLVNGSPSFIARIAAGVVGFAAFIINYIISIILGVVINLEAWFVEIVLAMNDQILKSEFVQSGYQISLAVANLIFVAGLIVIAIATILRRESYSMKQVLWKLILMAVLVNFGLSLAGVLIQISSNFSWYFLNSINPGGGTGESQYGSFARAIAGAFTPQRFFITNITEQGEVQTASNRDVTGPITQQDQQKIAGLFGSSLAKILTPIVSLFFTIAFLTVIIITLGALVVMLINRYIAISLLLILLPLAWALWIFPNIGSMGGLNPWREWWNRFIRWTFFAPIVLFFLYLCLLTLKATPGGEGDRPGVTLQNVNFTFDRTGPLGGLEAFGGSFLMNLAVPILNAIVMTGCAMGGLFAANKLGIEGADKAEALAKSTTKAIGMFAWNRTKGLGAAGLNKLLPKTPPPPAEKGRLGRALHTIGFKAGQLAERFGVREKIEETAEKYGPSTWPYLPKNWMQRRKQAKGIKNEINKINEELKDIPSAIARRQAEIQSLEQQLNTIKSKYQPDLQRLESIISNIRSQIEKTTDPQALAQLYQQRQALEAERSRILQEMNEETKSTTEEIAKKQNELKDVTGTLIAKRKEQYEKIRDLKPDGIFGTIINAATETYKKPKKVKIPKKALEEAGIEIEEEKKKEEPKQEQKSQPQQGQTQQV